MKRLLQSQIPGWGNGVEFLRCSHSHVFEKAASGCTKASQVVVPDMPVQILVSLAVGPSGAQVVWELQPMCSNFQRQESTKAGVNLEILCRPA